MISRLSDTVGLPGVKAKRRLLCRSLDLFSSLLCCYRRSVRKL